MSVKHDRKIQLLRDEVAESKLDEQHKSYAGDVLGDVAEATNGAQDKVQAITDALLAMTAYMIRRDIIIRADHDKQNDAVLKAMVKAVADHENGCPMKVLKMTGGQAAAIVISLAATAIVAIAKWG
jgi:hypothetical protein